MSKLIKITKQFNFEAAHFLPLHEGKCRNLHGHSYKLLVTCAGDSVYDKDSPSSGMLEDFSVIKAVVDPIVDQLDHALLARSEAAVRFYVGEPALQGKVYYIGEDTTAEMIATHLLEKINLAMFSHTPKLKAQVVGVTLYETATSSAEVSRAFF